jgi:hypothetical protein
VSSDAHDQDLTAGGQLAKLHRPAHSVIGDSLGPTAHKQQAFNQLAHDGLRVSFSRHQAENGQGNLPIFLQGLEKA